MVVAPGESAVETRGLLKRFGADVVAVDELDLRIERGETYGLLGPNDAGKTTTLRMLLGLVRPTSGVVKVLGLRPGGPAGLHRVGAMGETAFHPFLSGVTICVPRLDGRLCRIGGWMRCSMWSR